MAIRDDEQPCFWPPGCREAGAETRWNGGNGEVMFCAAHAERMDELCGPDRGEPKGWDWDGPGSTYIPEWMLHEA